MKLKFCVAFVLLAVVTTHAGSPDVVLLRSQRTGKLGTSRPQKLCLKVGRQRGMRSVPPRGSGWVQPVAFENLANSHADHQPTRYCVVVLTSCRVDDRLLRQSLYIAREQVGKGAPPPLLINRGVALFLTVLPTECVSSGCTKPDLMRACAERLYNKRTSWDAPA